MGRLPEASGQQGKKLAQAARLWASGQLTQQEEEDDAEDVYIASMAAMGLQPEESDDQVDASKPEIFYLWPCNVYVWHLWHKVQTQWHVGHAGRTGLDYPGVGFYLRQVAGVKPRYFPEVFGHLQAMERASLDEWQKARE